MDIFTTECMKEKFGVNVMFASRVIEKFQSTIQKKFRFWLFAVAVFFKSAFQPYSLQTNNILRGNEGTMLVADSIL